MRRPSARRLREPDRPGERPKPGRPGDVQNGGTPTSHPTPSAASGLWQPLNAKSRHSLTCMGESVACSKVAVMAFFGLGFRVLIVVLRAVLAACYSKRNGGIELFPHALEQ
jgi:hypothetical protein